MPSLNEVLALTRAALRESLYSYVDVGSMFSIDFLLREPSPWKRVATIQVHEHTMPSPVTFTLSLEHQPRPDLSEVAMTSSFEMAARFVHDEKQYGYWSSRWHERGQLVPAELVERHHPLAAVTAMTVDSTVMGVRSLVLLERLLAASFLHPDDIFLTDP
ncbi:MAG: hypothetical protein AAGC93_23325 [Cyanobacteria bacterium P01_F01_bin.53]